MPILLDSARLDDAHAAMALGFVAGITTNPILISQAGRPGLTVISDLLTICPGDVYYQVTAPSVEGRTQQARAASALDPARVLIKIPATTENLAMAAALAQEGVRCAITAVGNAAQAYLCAMAGADYAINYVNRLTRATGDGPEIVRACRQALSGSSTKLLAASLKSPQEVMDAIFAGADDVTLPLDIIRQMGEDTHSQAAIEDFAKYNHD